MKGSPIELSIPREWFSPEEVGRMIGRSAYTVRQWARLGRIAARKRSCGRGRSLAWEVHLSEIARYLDHGLAEPSHANR
jgi:hypothetical protein